MDAAGQRELAMATFNRVWELLERPERTPEETDEMIHAAHVSCYVWSRIGAPVNVARGEWQCARVYATLGRAEPALWHASRCLELNEAGGEGFEDWDFASAQQGMAHGHLATGDMGEARRWAGSLAQDRNPLARIPVARTIPEAVRFAAGRKTGVRSRGFRSRGQSLKPSASRPGARPGSARANSARAENP